MRIIRRTTTIIKKSIMTTGISPIFSTAKRMLAGIAAAITVFTTASCGSDDYYNIEGYAQGGTYRITLEAGLEECRSLQKEVEKILSDIDNSISGYNPASALSAFNGNVGEYGLQDGGLPESTPTAYSLGDKTAGRIFEDVLRISIDMHEETDGYFDVSAGALFDAWGFGFKEGIFPDSTAIDSIKRFTGMDKIIFDNGRIVKTDPRVRLNFNAVAQGYTCDTIAGYLTGKGISNMLINVGGEIFCKGLNPHGKNWTIGIDAPVDGNMESGADIQTVIEIPCGENGKGVVTSGNYRKYYIRDGKKYAHTVNPKTGYPVEHNLLSATVIADNAATADALATYMMVVGLEESIKYVETHFSIEAVLIYEQDGQMKTWMSPGVNVHPGKH